MNKKINIKKFLDLETLDKSEIFKPETRTAIDLDEIKIALEVVPKAIMSYLIHNLKHLKAGDNINLPLFFVEGYEQIPNLHVTKISKDVYTGEITCLGKRLTDFKYRTLPGIGLIVLSTFELYEVKEDVDKVEQEEVKETKPDSYELFKIIDERIRLNSLIRGVVEEKITEREAIQEMINHKLSESAEIDEEDDLEDMQESEEIEILDECGDDIMDSKSKKSKLREFLESRERKRQEKVSIEKKEKISCPDCGSDLYKGEDHFKLCICYGENYNKEIKFKKSEDGRIVFNFPKKFDTDNVEMLLEAIKSNK